MKKINVLMVLVLLLGTTISYAQVGIGTTNPNNAAVLDITSTDKGLLPPRVTKANRDNIINPPAGLMLWCLDCGSDGEMQVYNGTEWLNMFSPSPVKVGDYSDGGVVFYVSPIPTDLNGDGLPNTGLVCAISDQATGGWGCSGTDLNGTDSLLVPELTSGGKGQANTSYIVNNCFEAGIAAKICNDLIFNGYDDWFLPSKDELKLMNNNLDIINATATANGGGFFNGSTYYWSSTEANANQAWAHYFQVFFPQQTLPKNSTAYSVRAVRAF